MTRVAGPKPSSSFGGLHRRSATARATVAPVGAPFMSTQLARFEAAVLPHLDAAYTLARYLTHDPHDAEDAVQDACLRALRYFDAFRGGDPRAWLLAIVRNRCYSLRHERRIGAPIEFDDELHSDTEAIEAADAAALRAAARESLESALRLLPEEFREVIVLRELQGLSYREIGEVTGVPVGTVMSRLSRARRRLQTALGTDSAERGRS